MQQQAPMNTGAPIDYNYLKWIIMECLKEHSSNNVMNESVGSVAGLKMMPGNKIQFMDSKGNIYEYMIWCDVHLTISSTTCLECHYYHKPTIFYNYSDMSVNYYSKVLSESNGAIYTNDAKEFGVALKNVLSQKFEYKEIFASDTIQKIKDIINK